MPYTPDPAAAYTEHYALEKPSHGSHDGTWEEWIASAFDTIDAAIAAAATAAGTTPGPEGATGDTGATGPAGDPATDAATLQTHPASDFALASSLGTAAAKNVPATGDAASTEAVLGSDTRLTNVRTPTAHKSTHATGGTDVLSVTDIGAAAAVHNHDAAYLGIGAKAADADKLDGIDSTGFALIGDTRLTNTRTPTAHATTHKTGGADAVKLDELAAPTNITTLNATTSLHGLCPKGDGNSAHYLNGALGWDTPAGSAPTLLSGQCSGTIAVGSVVHAQPQILRTFLNWEVAEPVIATEYTIMGFLQSLFGSSFTYASKWGSSGLGNGQFTYPCGVAVDDAGNVYVADSENYRIQKFTSTGTYLAQWGDYGMGNGQFDGPMGVAVDSAGNVYVADYGNSLIQKFTSSGIFITQWGSGGLEDGQFNHPQGVAVDSAGNIYVADRSNNRIQKFTSAGIFITKWGGYGTGDGQFDNPVSLAVDNTGNVYVADWYNNRIQKFTSAGIFITQWGSYGMGDGQLNDPVGIAVDSAGNVYVADTNYTANRIQKFTSAGTFITKWGSRGYNDGQFRSPGGIAVDSAGNVYVADSDNNRIQKFTPSPLSVAVSGIVPIPETSILPGYAVWLGAGGTLSDASTGDVPRLLGWVVDSTHLLLDSNPEPATSGSGGDAATLQTHPASDFALATKGVTNGDSHDHNGGDGAQIAYGSLFGAPTTVTPTAGTKTTYRSALAAVDKITKPTITAAASATAGSLTNVAHGVTIVCKSGYGLTDPCTIVTATPTASTSINVTIPAVTGATSYVIFLSTWTTAPLRVAEVTEAQRAAGCAITAVNTVGAGGSAGVVNVQVVGTGLPSTDATYSVNYAYLPDPIASVNTTGKTAIYTYVDFTVSSSSSAFISVTPFVNINSVWQAGLSQTLKLTNPTEQMLVLDLNGATGFKLLINSISGTGAAATLSYQLVSLGLS